VNFVWVGEFVAAAHTHLKRRVGGVVIRGGSRARRETLRVGTIRNNKLLRAWALRHAHGPIGRKKVAALANT
jgi:hypothetical protein